jgi:lipoprotein signal peptidase
MPSALSAGIETQPGPFMSEPTAPGCSTDEDTVDPQTLSFRHLPSHLRLWCVAASGLSFDLWSKHWAFSSLKGRSVVVPHLLQFQRSLNPGALFGFGQGMAPVFIGASMLALIFVLYLFVHTPRSRWSMHIALGLILAGALGNLHDRTFVIADAVWGPSSIGWRSWLGDEVVMTGKLIRQSPGGWIFGEWPEGSDPQRYIPKREGWYVRPCPVVRDFVKIDTAWLKGYQLWKWIFNVADTCLVVGVGLLLLNFWRDRQHHNRAMAQEQTSVR